MGRNLILLQRKLMQTKQISNCFFFQAPEKPPISYTMHYQVGRIISANWSTTAKFNDYSTTYPVVEYTEYAPNIEKFIEMFPTFTIETSGEAKSGSAFGDVGTGHFGTVQFETIHFNNKDFNLKHMVYAHKNHFTFDVGAEIGINIKKDDKKLYLQPFINGWIYSVGAYWRELRLGLSVTKITFHPKN